MNLKSSSLGFLRTEITDVHHHTRLSKGTLANTKTQKVRIILKEVLPTNRKYDGGKFKTKEN